MCSAARASRVTFRSRRRPTASGFWGVTVIGMRAVGRWGCFWYTFSTAAMTWGRRWSTQRMLMLRVLGRSCGHRFVYVGVDHVEVAAAAAAKVVRRRRRRRRVTTVSVTATDRWAAVGAAVTVVSTVAAAARGRRGRWRAVRCGTLPYMYHPRNNHHQ